MAHSFKPSTRKTYVIAAFFLLFCTLIFGFSRGIFEITAALTGFYFGLIFSGIIIFFSLGQRISIIEDEIQFFSNFLELYRNKPQKKLLISRITQVSLGLPSLNKAKTFSAINILTTTEEISFNPDLYADNTLHTLFRALKEKNSSISFDNYTQKIYLGNKSTGEFTQSVLKNFFQIIILPTICVIFVLICYKLELI